MYPFLPRCAVYGKECGGAVILQKSCMKQALGKVKFLVVFTAE